MRFNKKKVITNIGIILCFFIIPIMFIIAHRSTKVVDNAYTDLKQVYELGKDEKIEQKVYVDNPIETLSFYVATGGERQNNGNIQVSIIGDEKIDEQTIDISGISDWSEMKIPIKKNNIRKQWLTIVIQGSNVEKGSSLYFIFDNSANILEKAMINGVVQEKSLCMKYTEKVTFSLEKNILILVIALLAVIYLGWYCYTNKTDKIKILTIAVLLLLETLFIHFFGVNVYPNHLTYINKLYVLIIGIITITICGVLYFLKKKIKIEYIATFCIFCFGIVYMIILPAYSAPDEPAHFATAYKISNQLLLQRPMDEQGNALVRKCDNNFFDISPSKEIYRKNYANILDSKNIDTTIVPLEGTFVVKGSVIAHLPGAIGITIARVLHLNNSLLLMMGRMMGLLFYCVIIYYAIKIIPFGKMILFIVSMFPMMLEEISSFGYDLVVNGFSFFLIAYILYLIYEKQNIRYKDIAIVSIVFFLLAPCKVVYIFIAGMCILIPKNKFDNIINKTKSIAIIIVSGLIPNIIINLGTVLGNASSNAGMLGWANERSYTLGDVLQNIPNGICVFLNTLFVKGEFYLNTLIGGSLGWFEISISSFIITGFILVFILETFRPIEQYSINKKEKSCYVSIVVIVALAVIAAMWLSWTPISSSIVEGVQGRYFLPIVPLLYLSVANCKKIQIKSSVTINIILVCLLNVYAVLDILKVTFGR